MIKSGFSSREAILRMFGIHHGHLKGMQILFAHYETNGLHDGEAWVLLKKIKTDDLLCVHAKHSHITPGGFKTTFQGPVYREASAQSVFNGQWAPKLILPEVALKIDPIRENFRIARILKKRIRERRAVKLLSDYSKFTKATYDRANLLNAIFNRGLSLVNVFRSP